MDPKLLENRLSRERAARKQAEQVLEQKSYELHCTNQALRSTAQELDAQTVQLNSILDNTAAAIMVTDARGGVVRVNKMATSLFGSSRLSVGAALSAVFDVASQNDVARLFLSGNSDDEPLELIARDHTGQPFPVDASVAHLSLEDTTHTVWICRDLRVRKKLEQELRQAQKMEALGALASGVAHEINTPIQFVSDNIRFLQDSFEDLMTLIEGYQHQIASVQETLPQQMKDAIADLEEKADLDFLKGEIPESIDQSLEGMQRIGTIVSAIKEFSHPGVEDNAPIDVNKAIETTATVTKNQWKYVAELQLNLAENLPPAFGNPGDFNQVVVNLLVNAVDAIADAKAGALGTISVSTLTKGDRLILLVEDDGCGIPPDVKAKIFDPFFTTKDVGKGTGQGLAITYNIIVNKMGGEIAVASLPGQGTTFTISLPVKPGEAI